MTRPGRFSIDSLASVHVLLVDDQPTSRSELLDVLRYCGALVTVAEDEDDARAQLSVVEPDVILLALAHGRRRQLALLSTAAPDRRRRRPIPLVLVVEADDPFQLGPGVSRVLRRPLNAWDVCRGLAAVVLVP